MILKQSINKIFLIFFTIQFFANSQDPIKVFSEILASNDFALSSSNGFLGSKTIDLLIKRCKTNIEKAKPLLTCNILWFLLKFNFKLERYLTDKNMALTFTIRPLYFDYGHYYIPIGCIDGYPGPHCILRKLGCCALGFGFDFYYNDRKSDYKFSHNLTFFLNIVAKKIIPFDFIISYSPFIFSINRGIYVELSLINFSLGNFIKSIIMSTLDLDKQHIDNWKKKSGDDSEDSAERKRYRIKVKSLHSSGGGRKAKFILIDNLLLILAYNIRLYIGFRF